MTSRTVISCKNPVWADSAQTCIICQIVFKEVNGTFPFNAMATDPEKYGRDLFAELSAGKYGAIGAYVAPAPKSTQAGGGGPRVS